PAYILRFPLNRLVFQYGSKAGRQNRDITLRFFVQAEFERLKLAGMLEILFFRNQHGISLGQPALCFIDFLFERGGVYRAFIDIEQSDVVERYLVEKDDEFDQIRIRLLPEGFLAAPEEI